MSGIGCLYAMLPINHIELVTNSREYRKMAGGNENSLCFFANLEKHAAIIRLDTFESTTKYL